MDRRSVSSSPVLNRDFPDLQGCGKDSMSSTTEKGESSVQVAAAVGKSGEKASNPRNWSDLFAKPMGFGLGFYPPERKGRVVTVRPPTEVIEEGAKQWENSLVAQFIGRIPNFNQFKKMVNVLWGEKGEVEVRPVGKNLFLIQFADKETCEWVLTSGPWHIMNLPIFVRRWEEGMGSLEFSLDKLPIWLNFKNIPLELYTLTGLSYVASGVGKPLYLDKFTAQRDKLAFAKICVEVEAGMEIPLKLQIALRNGKFVEVDVEVPWFPEVCSHCKVFGHSTKQCQHQKKEIAPVTQLIPKKSQMESKGGKEDIEASVAVHEDAGKNLGKVGTEGTGAVSKEPGVAKVGKADKDMQVEVSKQILSDSVQSKQIEQGKSTLRGSSSMSKDKEVQQKESVPTSGSKAVTRGQGGKLITGIPMVNKFAALSPDKEDVACEVGQGEKGNVASTSAIEMDSESLKKPRAAKMEANEFLKKLNPKGRGKSNKAALGGNSTHPS